MTRARRERVRTRAGARYGMHSLQLQIPQRHSACETRSVRFFLSLFFSVLVVVT